MVVHFNATTGPRDDSRQRRDAHDGRQGGGEGPRGGGRLLFCAACCLVGREGRCLAARGRDRGAGRWRHARGWTRLHGGCKWRWVSRKLARARCPAILVGMQLTRLSRCTARRFAKHTWYGAHPRRHARAAGSLSIWRLTVQVGASEGHHATRRSAASGPVRARSSPGTVTA